MHILLVYHELSFRGGEEYFRILSKALLKKGHSVSFITGRVGQKAKIFPTEVKIIAPLPLLNKLFTNTFCYFLFAPVLIFFSLLKESYKTDRIYTGESFLSLWPAVIASIFIRKPLILIVFELTNDSHFTNSPSGLFYALFTFIHNKFIKQIRAAISINESLVSILKKRYSIPHVRYIPIGIDLEMYKNSNTQTITKKYDLSDKPTLIMPGLLHPAKNQDVAIKTIGLLKKSFPTITLFIIGDGQESYKKLLTDLIRDLKLEKNVFLVGFVPDEEMKNYYAVSDMVIMCGPIAGFTVIESLIMNRLPVYPTSGNPPLGPVEPLHVGIVVKHNAPEEYAAVITSFLNDPQKYKKKIAEERKRLITVYSLKSFSEKLFR